MALNMDTNEEGKPAGAKESAAKRKGKVCICNKSSCPARADSSLKFVSLPKKDGERSMEKKIFNRRRWLVHLGLTEATLPDVKHHYISVGHFPGKNLDSNGALTRWTKGVHTTNAADVFRDKDGIRETLSVPSVTLEEMRGERRKSSDHAVAIMDREREKREAELAAERERREAELAAELESENLKRTLEDAGIEVNNIDGLTPKKQRLVVDKVGPALQKTSAERNTAR